MESMMAKAPPDVMDGLGHPHPKHALMNPSMFRGSLEPSNYAYDDAPEGPGFVSAALFCVGFMGLVYAAVGAL